MLCYSWPMFEQKRPGASIPHQPKRYSPQLLPFPLPSRFPPFPSLPLFLLPLVLPPIHFPAAAKWPVETSCGSGECCKLPQWGLGYAGASRHRFWCILRGKNSFDSNYYMDFCILKFVKLLIKSPQIVLCAFVANGR